MKTLRISFFSCLFTLLCLLPAFLTARAVELPPAASSAAGTPDTPDPLVTASQAFSVSINGPARRVAVITLTPAAGYHFYAREAGEAGKPVAIIALAGDEERPVLYPQGTPKPDAFNPSLTVNVHDGPARFYVPLPDDPRGTDALMECFGPYVLGCELLAGLARRHYETGRSAATRRSNSRGGANTPGWNRLHAPLQPSGALMPVWRL